MQRDTREIEARAKAVERALAERRARSEQASASQSFPSFNDGRQAAYAREADRGLSQPHSHYAGELRHCGMNDLDSCHGI